MGKLSPFWAFVCEYSKCERMGSPHNVEQDDASEKWQAMDAEMKDGYKKLAAEYNKAFSKAAVEHFGKRPFNTYYHSTQCVGDTRMCGLSQSVQATKRQCEHYYGTEYTVDEYLNEWELHAPGCYY